MFDTLQNSHSNACIQERGYHVEQHVKHIPTDISCKDVILVLLLIDRFCNKIGNKYEIKIDKDLALGNKLWEDSQEDQVYT